MRNTITKFMGVVGLLFATAIAGCGEESSDDGAMPSGEQGASDALAQDGCKIAGCNAELCLNPGEEELTTCEWREEYACYQAATCARQSDGQCDWTETPQLQACLQKLRDQ